MGKKRKKERVRVITVPKEKRIDLKAYGAVQFHKTFHAPIAFLCKVAKITFSTGCTNTVQN
jgi:hypothetical protein